jgi:branched-subunit amino acid aminotransferase/4-amino-4-deoxychorismate lyase
VSRGAFRGRGLLPPDEKVEPTMAIAAWPIVPPPAGHLEQGLALVASSVRRDPASPLASLKTTSRADYVFARLEARGRGADDALFLTLDGHLSEATSANLFLVRHPRQDGASGSATLELATPALDYAILPGTTRSWLLGWARRVGLRPLETALTPADLMAAEEAFVSSSVAGVLPVTRWEGVSIGDGRPGPWARRAREDREAFIREA